MPALIGNLPNQVPTNGDLGTMAYRDQANFYNVGQTVGFRNRIINGDMRIDQRNLGAAVTGFSGGGKYTVDRWAVWATGGALTAQQSTLVPPGFDKSLSVTVTTADATLDAGDYYLISQAIEGNNIADFNWGSANAKAITISFWVRTSVTGTYSGAVRNASANYTYPFQFTVNQANTWEYETITIPGPTSGSWNADNTLGMYLWISMATGTLYSDVAGAWTTKANVVGASSSINMIATNGATFHITGVQLEVGLTATNFDTRFHGTELMFCQRYYMRYQLTGSFPFVGRTLSDNRVQLNLPLRYQMRTTPSLVSSDITAVNNIYFGTSRVSPNGTQTYSLSGHESVDIGGILITGGGTYTDGQIAVAQITGSIAYSAEL